MNYSEGHLEFSWFTARMEHFLFITWDQDELSYKWSGSEEVEAPCSWSERFDLPLGFFPKTLYQSLKNFRFLSKSRY